MTFYAQLVYFQMLRYFSYPVEIVGTILKRAIEVGFVVLFWIVVAQSSHGKIDTTQIVSYILISSSVAGIASSSNLYFGGMIQQVIKSGEINNYLIKPIKLVPYLYATFFGQRIITVGIGLVTLFLGIALNPSAFTVANCLLFSVYFILALSIVNALSVLIGLCSFYMTEASGVRYSIGHVIRVLSGALAPLSLFPQPWRNLVLLTPFPVTIYGPASVFAPSTTTVSHLQLLLTGIFWAITLWIIANLLWKRSLKHYDAIGI